MCRWKAEMIAALECNGTTLLESHCVGMALREGTLAKASSEHSNFGQEMMSNDELHTKYGKKKKKEKKKTGFNCEPRFKVEI